MFDASLDSVRLFFMARIFAYMSAACLLFVACDSAPPDTGPIARIRVAGKAHTYCSGALVGPRAILTAAHCLVAAPRSGFEVDVGGATYSVARMVPHPEWAEGRVTDDIGVIFLHEAPPIPSVQIGDADLHEGDSVTAHGFAPGHLHTIPLQIRKVVSPTLYLLTTEQESLCKGDSGGPQFAGGALVAVNSRGECARVGIGELVAPHLEWLISQGL